jgi:hypothetical protein
LRELPQTVLLSQNIIIGSGSNDFGIDFINNHEKPALTPNSRSFFDSHCEAEVHVAGVVLLHLDRQAVCQFAELLFALE